MFFGPDEPIDGTIDRLSREFLERTRENWVEWVRGIGVPFDWQTQVIRAAITLKLCNYDDTGAVVAAHTTSIPEAPNTSRNWDYRYCWLRDVLFVIRALNRLGATQTMEGYLNYVANIAVGTQDELRPVYGIVHDEPLPEWIAPDLAGYQGMGPVRVGNQASEQRQHDSYGSVILAASHMFLDERLPHMGDANLFSSLEPLAEHARRLVLTPDAGIWEYRGRTHIHTYSAAMCWVACDRMAKIAQRLGNAERASHWRQEANTIRSLILSKAWNDSRRALVGALDHTELDASVLLLPYLGLLPAHDERFIATCNAIGRELNRKGYIQRYTNADDFGAPDAAFLACQFWYCDALTAIGRKDEARELFCDVLERCTELGMLSEDIHPTTLQLWGNTPQAYSMAGIINTGMALSRSWDEAWGDS
jgi:GH15 family glucan-1,4-alpha-glucosidase